MLGPALKGKGQAPHGAHLHGAPHQERCSQTAWPHCRRLFCQAAPPPARPHRFAAPALCGPTARGRRGRCRARELTRHPVRRDTPGGAAGKRVLHKAGCRVPGPFPFCVTMYAAVQDPPSCAHASADCNQRRTPPAFPMGASPWALSGTTGGVGYVGSGAAVMGLPTQAASVDGSLVGSDLHALVCAASPIMAGRSPMTVAGGSSGQVRRAPHRAHAVRPPARASSIRVADASQDCGPPHQATGTAKAMRVVCMPGHARLRPRDGGDEVGLGAALGARLSSRSSGAPVGSRLTAGARLAPSPLVCLRAARPAPCSAAPRRTLRSPRPARCKRWPTTTLPWLRVRGGGSPAVHALRQDRRVAADCADSLDSHCSGRSAPVA